MLAGTRQGGAQDLMRFHLVLWKQTDKLCIIIFQRGGIIRGKKIKSSEESSTYRDPGFFSTPFFFPSFSFLRRVFSLSIFLSLSTTQLNTKLSVIFFFPRHISQGSEKGVSLRSSSAFSGPSLVGCMVGEILRVKGASMCCGCFVPVRTCYCYF